MQLSVEYQLQSELASGEHFLWSGQPRGGVRLQPTDAFLIPFSLLWAGFAVLWETSVLRAGAPVFFALWGIPFVLAGLYIVVGRFVFDAWRRARTIYAVTDRRVLIISGMPERRVQSLPLQSLADLTLTERGDRSGTIVFGVGAGPLGARFGASSWPGTRETAPPTFAMIDDARHVYEIIRDAQAKLIAPRA